MNINIARSTAGLGICLLSFAMSGCMIGPNNGDVFADRDTIITFWGGTLVPEETVEIQVKNRDDVWETIADGQTTSYHWTFNSTDWYYFGIRSSIPREHWRYNYVERMYYVEARAIAASMTTGGSNALFTFRQGTLDEFDGYEDLGSNFPDYVHGKSVTIYAESY